MTKIEEQDFQSLYGRWFKCGVLIVMAFVLLCRPFYKWNCRKEQHYISDSPKALNEIIILTFSPSVIWNMSGLWECSYDRVRMVENSCSWYVIKSILGTASENDWKWFLIARCGWKCMSTVKTGAEHWKVVKMSGLSWKQQSLLENRWE